MRDLLAFLFAATLSVMAQTATTAVNPPAQTAAPSATGTTEPASAASAGPATAGNGGATRQIEVPAGTQVLLVLKSPITTKSARVGDGVYCQTNFPVTINNVNVIPAGTYVKGTIAEVKRAGKIKGRAQILFHFNTLIFPNGYTIDMPGSLGNDPSSQNSKVVDKEGTVQADSQKGKDAGTVATTGATGAVIGSVADRSLKGAGIGGLAGAAVGLGEVLFTRGQDVRIEQGSALEMVLQRPLIVDLTHGNAVHADNEIVPRSDSKRLSVPGNPK